MAAGNAVILAAACPAVLAAQVAADTSTRVEFGGLVDVYFAYDVGRPRNIDRVFTTQAARHDEINVNLAYVEAVLNGPRVRGRLAIQFGTSVQANYASEARIGALSGPEISRFIQEASVGYQVARTLWIDAGVLFAPFGAESWISRDNWTYTRSLIADYSPYYEAGIKATWQVAQRFAVQVHVMNGWQNISESNSDKAVAWRLDYSPTARLTLTYDNFIGNEAPDSVPPELRIFQEGIVRVTVTKRLQLSGTFDYGTQRRTSGHGRWRGYSLLGRYQITPQLGLGVRFEGYSDPEQVMVATGRGYGFRAHGASLNVDVALRPMILWRTEVRGLVAPDRLFPDRSTTYGLARRNTFFVTSVALTF